MKKREIWIIERPVDGRYQPATWLPLMSRREETDAWFCDGDRVVRYVPAPKKAKPKRRAKR